jgi:hypothetical protein
VIYYATYPIHEVGRKGDNHWNYQLPEIFLIGMMDFEFDHSPKSIFHHQVKLMELTTKEVFYDKLTFIFLEMSKFVKREEELETSFDKWMFLLKYLRDFQEPPTVLEGNPFDKIFNIASIANLNKEEMNAYEASLKQQRDWNSALAYAEMKGREEGHELGREEGREEGLELGLEKGLELGREEGLELGLEKGLELGREEGLELGREEGLELGLEKGLELGREEGLEKGREEALEKVKKAIALIKRGYQKSEIADLTGLSSKELDELFE